MKMSELEEKCNTAPNKQLALVPINNSLIDKFVRKLKILTKLDKTSS